MKTHRFVYTALATALALAACTTIPEKNDRLEEARSEYNIARTNPDVTTHANVELTRARDALIAANDAWSKDENTKRVDQLAYLTKQQVAIAKEAAKMRVAEATATNSKAERSGARLSAKTREADAANQNAEVARMQAENAKQSAAVSQSQAESAKQSAAASQSQSEEAQRQAASQQQRAQSAEARSNQLEAQLKELAAKKTERGLVVTFGDLLFDTNMANVKPGGMRNVQKLADVLNQYPERTVLIEGFTDNTGADNHNQDLSDRRANAVRTTLRDMGISGNRVTGRGYGKGFPVASNDTMSGRQLNRRVEVIISDDSGKIAPR